MTSLKMALRYSIKSFSTVSNSRARQLRKGVNFHESGHSSFDKPLVVLTGWLGSTDRQLKPYVNFYNSNNIDAITLSVGVPHILFPDLGMKEMENLLDSIFEIAPKKLVFHQFSMGGYLYGQALRALKKNSEKSDKFSSMLRAQVFDSPPDHGNIANGISKSVGRGVPGGEVVTKALVTAYLKAVHNTTGVEHRAASSSFYNNHMKAPSLLFYSKSDVVADWKDCAKVADTWRQNGIPVEECIWDNTPHIQHGRVDPDRYFKTLTDFLSVNDVVRR